MEKCLSVAPGRTISAGSMLVQRAGASRSFGPISCDLKIGTARQARSMAAVDLSPSHLCGIFTPSAELFLLDAPRSVWLRETNAMAARWRARF